MTIAQLLTSLTTSMGTILTAFAGVLDLFTSNAILLLGVAMTFTGAIIRKARHLIGR